ncbi:hypothetical protein Poli38472_007123 [Pythium oligandrum]|uniref:RING-type domain-containing protein n=1 Tax=Pythium oligandrum TaxID=41045 RepID=A0A8K1FHP9_PYTOL|nr:hypothetical protein Poli38472_007123 [Pythium oligandrum]|eukprot:TMW58978.1 hypothetical protein Poli38472_007123 [Pythium oligandrum]
MSTSTEQRLVNALEAAVCTIRMLSPSVVPGWVPPAPVPTTCQICMDDFEPMSTPLVTKLCHDKCPAVLCPSCVAEHVRIAVEDAFPGVLPKVRCPICLTFMNKSKWLAYTSSEVLAAYKSVCQRACTYQTPCCHNANYTQLPVGMSEHNKYGALAPLKLVPSLKAKFPQLRALTKQFCNHKLPSKTLIRFIEDEFGAKTSLETQHLLVEHMYTRILDEERRATLLLAYHAKYKLLKTRCCNRIVCFNCKRGTLPSHTVCDKLSIKSDCIVECRSCRVTIVKVDGCDVLRCWCGFIMNWPEEVQIRNQNQRGLIPVDISDTELYSAWSKWKSPLHLNVHSDLATLLHTKRVRHIDQMLLRYTPRLRRTVQHYAQKRRKSKLIAQLQEHMHAKELNVLTSKLKVTQVLEQMRRWCCQIHWQLVQNAIQTKFFWELYYDYHEEELDAIKDEEQAILLLGS